MNSQFNLIIKNGAQRSHVSVALVISDFSQSFVGLPRFLTAAGTYLG